MNQIYMVASNADPSNIASIDLCIYLYLLYAWVQL